MTQETISVGQLLNIGKEVCLIGAILFSLAWIVAVAPQGNYTNDHVYIMDVAWQMALTLGAGFVIFSYLGYVVPKVSGSK